MEELRHRSLFVISILLFVASSEILAASDTFIDFDATVGLDDNVTRAEYNRDIEHDTFVGAGATLGHTYWRGLQSSVIVSGGLNANKFIEFDGLSNISATGRVNFVYGFSSAFGSPWMSLSASYIVSEFESFLRDSDIYIAEATVGKRIDDRTDLRSAIAYKKRESEGRAFDTEDASWFINVDWTIMKKKTLYTTYKIQKGDNFSSADPTMLSLALLNAASPNIDPVDDVFPGKAAYMLDATTQLFTIGLNAALNLHSSWDVSARFLKTDAEGLAEYEGLLVRASYFYRYSL